MSHEGGDYGEYEHGLEWFQHLPMLFRGRVVLLPRLRPTDGGKGMSERSIARRGTYRRLRPMTPLPPSPEPKCARCGHYPSVHATSRRPPRNGAMLSKRC